MALRSASRTSLSIAGSRHHVRSPSSSPTTYSFIDHPRAADTSFNQPVILKDMRKETTGFSSVSGVLGMSCGVDEFVLHVNNVSPTTRSLEHRPATRVDRWMDRSL